MTVWVEQWQDTSAWQQVTPACQSIVAASPSLTLTCAVLALRSIQTYDPAQPWSVEGSFLARNETPNKYGLPTYWGSLGWWHEDDPVANYVTAVEEYGVAPINGGPFVGMIGGNLADVYGPHTPGSQRTWRVEWKPDKQKTWLYLDGQRVGRYAVRPAGPMRATLLCVGGDTGAPGSAVARCVFGPLTVTGVPL